jgi:hypothetical protein
MSNLDKTYCSLKEDDCIGFQRKNCKDCPIYKKAIEKAYNISMKMLNDKYLLQQNLD